MQPGHVGCKSGTLRCRSVAWETLAKLIGEMFALSTEVRPLTACDALPVTSPRGLHVGVLALLYLAITSVPGFPGR